MKLAALLLAALGFIGGTAAAQGLDLSQVTLTVADVGWKEDAALLKLAGLDNTPYKLNIQTFQGGALAMEAMAADKADITLTSETPPIFASLAANKGNFRIIAILRWTTLHQELLVPPGSTISSVAGLKGKRVGYIKSTTAHYFLYQMLRQAGLGWNDIQRVEITTADGVTALLSGGLDAFASYGNSITAAKRRGARQLASAENILSGNFPVVAAATALQNPAKRAALVDYIARLNAARHFAEQHPEAWAKASADPTGRDYEIALADIKAEHAQRPADYVTINPDAIASQRSVADVLYQTGLLQQPVDVAAFYDDSLSAQIAQAKNRYVK